MHLTGEETSVPKGCHFFGPPCISCVRQSAKNGFFVRSYESSETLLDALLLVAISDAVTPADAGTAGASSSLMSSSAAASGAPRPAPSVALKSFLGDAAAGFLASPDESPARRG